MFVRRSARQFRTAVHLPGTTRGGLQDDGTMGRCDVPGRVTTAAVHNDDLMRLPGGDHAPANLAEVSLTCFGENNGIDLDLPSRGNDRKPLAFD